MDQQLWRKPFVMIMVINFLLFLSFNMLNPVFPLWLKGQGISETAIGLFVSLFTLGSMALRPIAGNIYDSFGRKRIFLASTALFVVLVALYPVLPVLIPVMILRLIHGFDWGIASTGASTLATDVIPHQILGKGMGYFGMSMALSLALAPVLSISVFNAAGFTVTMMISSLICLTALMAGLFFPYPPENLRPFHGAREILERTAIAPAIMMGCTTLTMSAVTTFVPLYALEDLGMPNVGPYFTIYAIGLLITRPLLGTLIDRIGMMSALVPSFLLLLCGLVLLSQAHGLGILLVSGFLYGAGYGGAQTALQTLAVLHAPQIRHGAANGTFFIGFDLGIGAGALICGALSARVGFSHMYMLLTLSILLALTIAVAGHKHW